MARGLQVVLPLLILLGGTLLALWGVWRLNTDAARIVAGVLLVAVVYDVRRDAP